MSFKAKLITFEGGEGAGKSTQLSCLAKNLEASGCRVIGLREPGGTALGEQLRTVLKNPATKSVEPETEALLFAACRAQLVKEVIVPALAAGSFVLCDRFIDSTVAYQAGGRGLNREQIDAANRLACGPLRPDLTILLDLDPDCGLSRAAVRDRGQADRFELLGKEFHRKVRAAYRQLALDEPNRFLVVDANRDAKLIAEEIWNEVRRRFS